jgi:hypothetical protein
MPLPSQLAIHESGHCAAQWLQGLPVCEAVLGKSRGYCSAVVTPDSLSFFVVLLAGPTVEVLVFGEFVDGGPDGDMAKAIRIAQRLGRDPREAIQDFTARWGVKLRQALPTIIRLAVALDSQGWLCGLDVLRILEQGDHQ